MNSEYFKKEKILNVRQAPNNHLNECQVLRFDSDVSVRNGPVERKMAPEQFGKLGFWSNHFLE